MIWYDRCRVHNCLNKNHVLTTCTVCKCKKYMHIIYCLIHRHLCLPFLLHQLLRHPSHPRDCLYSPNMLCQAMLGAKPSAKSNNVCFQVCMWCMRILQGQLPYAFVHVHRYIYIYTVCINILYVSVCCIYFGPILLPVEVDDDGL